MELAVLNQFAGQGTVGDELVRLLADTAYSRLRVLMAFCRGSGIGLISDALGAFLDRGGTLEAVIGLDLRGTSPDALESLVELGGEVYVFGVKGDRTFHPKVCILDDPRTSRYSAIIGSSNWTAGGLDSNFETAVRLDFRAGKRRDRATKTQLEDLWSTYRTPVPPMGPSNIRRVDKGLVHRLATDLAKEPPPPPDQRANALVDKLFDPITAPRKTPTRAPRSRRPPASTPATPPPSLPTTLFLDVPGPETGQGREIQLPIDVLRDYFGIDRTDVYYMTFLHADGTEETNRPLAVYDINTTFRISSSKFREITPDKRPMIVQLDRQAGDPDTFRVTIILHSTAEYAQAEVHLTRGGGQSKRWGTA